MNFAITHILGTMLQPAAVLVLVAALGVAMLPRRAGRRLATAGVLGMLALLVLPVQQWALLPLEDRFPRPPLPPRVDGIIVLGGAVEPIISAERGVPALNAAGGRMTEFVALARQYPQARLVFTGGVGSVLPGVRPEAEAASLLFASLGVAPDRLVLEEASRTTFENAVDTARLIGPAKDQVWLLVTSANHMPRAVGVFRHLGWNVVPWPVAYQTTRALLPAATATFGQRLEQLDTAIHEWTGLLSYRLTGKTDTLFPAP